MKYNRLLFILITILSLFVFTGYSIQSYSKKYYETPSDVAIVLGAGVKHGKLSNVFKERVHHAIYLLDNKKVSFILLTGGYGANEILSDAKVAKEYAISLGVDDSQILIEETSTITFYNILNAKMIMHENYLHSALIVSDPYHMKRAMHMCDKLGVQSYPSPTLTTMYRSRKTKFQFLCKEVINFWAYYLIGQHRLLWS